MPPAFHQLSFEDAESILGATDVCNKWKKHKIMRKRGNWKTSQKTNYKNVHQNEYKKNSIYQNAATVMLAVLCLALGPILLLHVGQNTCIMSYFCAVNPPGQQGASEFAPFGSRTERNQVHPVCHWPAAVATPKKREISTEPKLVSYRAPLRLLKELYSFTKAIYKHYN